MLSSVLRSEKAIQVNIAIMRTFVKMRHAMLTNQELGLRMERLEGKVNVHDTDIRILVQDVEELRKKSNDIDPELRRVQGFIPD